MAAPEASVTLPSMPPVTAVCPCNMPMLTKEKNCNEHQKTECGGVHRGASLIHLRFCSKICPGWGVTDRAVSGRGPFAAINQTRQHTSSHSRRGSYPIFGQSVKRNIVNTNVYKSGNGARTASSVGWHRNRAILTLGCRADSKKRPEHTFLAGIRATETMVAGRRQDVS